MSPQLPETVCSTMQALTDGLRSILGDRLVGVYLGGSIASGDFAESTSDLDFLVITDGALSLEDALAVELFHRDLLRRLPFAARLEGDYAPLNYIIPEGTTAPVPGCEKGVFLPKVGEIMLSADNICDMRQHSICFHGPEAWQILPTVSQEQVRSAVREMIIHGPGTYETAEEAAAATLNLLRSACALETGMPTTKSVGAAWGLAKLDERWHPAIHAALAVRRGESTPAHGPLLLGVLPDLDRYIREQV